MDTKFFFLLLDLLSSFLIISLFLFLLFLLNIFIKIFFLLLSLLVFFLIVSIFLLYCFFFQYNY